ncbi:MAG: L-glyceraldehyde 3-phosphate reductase [Pseudomonadota bacterium]
MITHETNAIYRTNDKRYEKMSYRACGNSGIKLPNISLGLWHNFGGHNNYENARKMIHTAFDLGINHFDLANNYGPPYGSAENTFGHILAKDLKSYRDELFIASKAGYDMWPGPYGIGGSRKYLVSSCDQSLKRMGLDYVDVFYHHCMDHETPIEETMRALDYIVRSGRALYIGISSYGPDETFKAIKFLKELGTPLLVHQPMYNLFHREIEKGLAAVLQENAVGSIVFCPLAQGLLTDKYLSGIPQDSRVANEAAIHLTEADITREKLRKVRQLNDIARERGQSLAQMAIAWTLNNEVVSSCLVGASKPEQIINSVEALQNLSFSQEELKKIDSILNNEGDR